MGLRTSTNKTKSTKSHSHGPPSPARLLRLLLPFSRPSSLISNLVPLWSLCVARCSRDPIGSTLAPLLPGIHLPSKIPIPFTFLLRVVSFLSFLLPSVLDCRTSFCRDVAESPSIGLSRSLLMVLLCMSFLSVLAIVQRASCDLRGACHPLLRRPSALTSCVC